MTFLVGVGGMTLIVIVGVALMLYADKKKKSIV